MVNPLIPENSQLDMEIFFHSLWNSLILPCKIFWGMRKLPTWGIWGFRFTSWSYCPSPSGSGLCPDPSTVRLLLESLCPWRSAWVWLLPLDFCISDPDTEDISALTWEGAGPPIEVLKLSVWPAFLNILIDFIPQVFFKQKFIAYKATVRWMFLCTKAM